MYVCEIEFERGQNSNMVDVMILQQYRGCVQSIRLSCLLPFLNWHCGIRSLCGPYRGTSLTRNTHLLGPYSRTLSRVIWWS